MLKATLLWLLLLTGGWLVWESHALLQCAESVQFTMSQFCYSLSKRLGALTVSQA